MNDENPPVPPKQGTGWRWLAFAWGFAEATFFFIVPDVLTSRLVIHQPKHGFLACLWALGGALLGGTLLFIVARIPSAVPAILNAFDYLPGIGPRLVEAAGEDLQTLGAAALFRGALAGIPYKLYVVQAVDQGMSLGVFLLASAAARLMRFGLVTALVWFISSYPLRRTSIPAKLTLHAAGWTVFYALYFWFMRG